MADRAHVLTDKELEKMERHLNGIYARAEKDVSEEFKTVIKEVKKKADELCKAIRRAEETDAIRAAEKAYMAFYVSDVLRRGSFKKATQNAQERLYRANQEAAQYINSKTDHIYAINYNQTGRDLQRDLDGYSFKPVEDEEVEKYGQVSRQMVNKKKDTEWNAKNIRNTIIAGALLSLAVDKVFKDASKTTTRRNRDSSNRQASDMLTDAESKGRLDSMYRAYDEGFNVKKQWICVYDNRTRDTHILYNDLGEVELDYEFADGLKRPKDSNCSIMEEVCNCRCALAHVTGKAQGGTRAARRGDVTDSYKNPSSFKGTETEYIKDMTYREWMEWRSR